MLSTGLDNKSWRIEWFYRNKGILIKMFRILILSYMISKINLLENFERKKRSAESSNYNSVKTLQWPCRLKFTYNFTNLLRNEF